MYNANGTDYRSTLTNQILGEFRINATVVGDQLIPAVAQSPSDRVVTVWTAPVSYQATNPSGTTTTKSDTKSRRG